MCGKFSRRHNGDDIYTGFLFFNTDTNKLIVLDSNKWVNLYGTEVDNSVKNL